MQFWFFGWCGHPHRPIAGMVQKGQRFQIVHHLNCLSNECYLTRVVCHYCCRHAFPLPMFVHSAAAVACAASLGYENGDDYIQCSSRQICYCWLQNGHGYQFCFHAH